MIAMLLAGALACAPAGRRPSSLIASRPRYCTRVAVTFTSVSRLGSPSRDGLVCWALWPKMAQAGRLASDATIRSFGDTHASSVWSSSTTLGTRYTIDGRPSLHVVRSSPRLIGRNRHPVDGWRGNDVIGVRPQLRSAFVRCLCRLGRRQRKVRSEGWYSLTAPGRCPDSATPLVPRLCAGGVNPEDLQTPVPGGDPCLSTNR